MIDFMIRLPWINRRRPFIAFHVAPFPAYQIRRGYARKVYHCGIIWGRQFMPNVIAPSSIWLDVPMLWKRAKP